MQLKTQEHQINNNDKTEKQFNVNKNNTATSTSIQEVQANETKSSENVQNVTNTVPIQNNKINEAKGKDCETVQVLSKGERLDTVKIVGSAAADNSLKINTLEKEPKSIKTKAAGTGVTLNHALNLNLSVSNPTNTFTKNSQKDIIKSTHSARPYISHQKTHSLGTHNTYNGLTQDVDAFLKSLNLPKQVSSKLGSQNKEDYSLNQANNFSGLSGQSFHHNSNQKQVHVVDQSKSNSCKNKIANQTENGIVENNNNNISRVTHVSKDLNHLGNSNGVQIFKQSGGPVANNANKNIPPTIIQTIKSSPELINQYNEPVCVKRTFSANERQANGTENSNYQIAKFKSINTQHSEKNLKPWQYFNTLTNASTNNKASKTQQLTRVNNNSYSNSTSQFDETKNYSTCKIKIRKELTNTDKNDKNNNNRARPKSGTYISTAKKLDLNLDNNDRKNKNTGLKTVDQDKYFTNLQYLQEQHHNHRNDYEYTVLKDLKKIHPSIKITTPIHQSSQIVSQEKNQSLPTNAIIINRNHNQGNSNNNTNNTRDSSHSRSKLSINKAKRKSQSIDRAGLRKMDSNNNYSNINKSKKRCNSSTGSYYEMKDKDGKGKSCSIGSAFFSDGVFLPDRSCPDRMIFSSK